ncbi:MAG: LCP family protein [Oscillospiraceae bacterium]
MDRYQKKPGREKSKKVKKPSRLTMAQKWMVAGIVVLSLILVVGLLYRAWVKRPDLPGAPGEDTEEISTENGIQPKAGGVRKTKDFYTFLVLGRDTGGGGNTDTMMLASYNVTEQKMTVMSIPRDTMVNVPWDIKRINSVYNYYGGGDKGIAALNQEISQLVGFVPDYQVIIEWDAFGDLVEAIGGVWFDVPRNMDYEDPYQDLSIHIKKGYQLLNREQAMGVIRFRDGKNGYANGDIGRIETQQGFMKAVVEQVLKVQNLDKIMSFSKIFTEKVETDLTVQNLFWFGKSAIVGGLSMENVNFVTMPYQNTSCWSRTYHGRQSYVTPKAEEMLLLVNESLSPFLDPVVMSELDIMSVNADGSVSSTTGHVADGKAAVPPSIPAKPKDPVVTDPKIDPVTGLPVEPTIPDPAIDPVTGLPVTDPSLPPAILPETPVPPETPVTPETPPVTTPPTPETPPPVVTPPPATPDGSLVPPGDAGMSGGQTTAPAGTPAA